MNAEHMETNDSTVFNIDKCTDSCSGLEIFVPK